MAQPSDKSSGTAGGAAGPSPFADDLVRLLLETLPHIAFLIGPDGKALFYNQMFRDYAGEALGPDAEHRTALHHPDDRERLGEARGRGTAKNDDYILEVRLRRHDGVHRWHRVHNKPMHRDGKVVAWLGTAVDVHDIREANSVLETRVAERTADLERTNAALSAEIAERQRTEQVLQRREARFRTLYDRTPMALHSVDGQARLVDVNDQWLKLFGMARADVLGHSPAEFMTPESGRRYREVAWPALLRSRGDTHTVEYQFLKRSGEVFDGRLSACGEFDADGEFRHSWSAIADVTAEKRAQAELLHALKTEAIGHLTSGVAHDFNNLLTIIMGGVELLRARKGGETRFMRLLDAVDDAAARGAALTRQLLAFGRRQRLSLEPIKLDALLADMREMLDRAIDPEIQVDIQPSVDLWTVVGDRSQLELVVLNLVLNARDAMPAGGKLTISIQNETLGERVLPEEPGPGDHVTLSLSDTGSGMSPETVARVFEPFFTTKLSGQGSGLGLPQVLGVAQQLGGGVRIASVVNGGTRVQVSIPRAGPE